MTDGLGDTNKAHVEEQEAEYQNHLGQLDLKPNWQRQIKKRDTKALDIFTDAWQKLRRLREDYPRDEDYWEAEEPAVKEFQAEVDRATHWIFDIVADGFWVKETTPADLRQRLRAWRGVIAERHFFGGFAESVPKYMHGQSSLERRLSFWKDLIQSRWSLGSGPISRWARLQDFRERNNIPYDNIVSGAARVTPSELTKWHSLGPAHPGYSDDTATARAIEDVLNGKTPLD